MSGGPRAIWLIAGCAVLAGCAAVRPALAPAPWERRLADLQHSSTWQLDGRAAVALGKQGWQASLDWRQSGQASEVHLAGPFGTGALVLKMTPAGLSLNGAPPSDAVTAQLQERLGFELPLDNLRYWLLGVPDPSSGFELTRNAQDRALHLTQAGWSIDYDRYMPNRGDLLPARLVLSRADARVRIAVDHWEGLR
jgi:outer membrane lipoprotein LolB